MRPKVTERGHSSPRTRVEERALVIFLLGTPADETHRQARGQPGYHEGVRPPAGIPRLSQRSRHQSISRRADSA